MPRSAATDTDVFGEGVGQLSSTEDHGHRGPLRTGVDPGSGQAAVGMRTGPRVNYRHGPKPWPVLLLSILGSAAALCAAGAFYAFLYPILNELWAERVRGEDGAEVRILGFWSILVLSLSAGCLCCVCSWILTYLDSYTPGMAFPTPLELSRLRGGLDQSFHMGYSVAVLNGVMATLTVIWSLT